MTLPNPPHEALDRAMRWTLWTIIGVGGLAPLILYWLCVGRLATVTPPRAKELLREKNASVVLIDIRSTDEFQARHIDGAKSWPMNELLAMDGRGDLPGQFRDKSLLIIRDNGLDSIRATHHLSSLGVERVVNVRGGIQEWIGSAAGAKADVFDQWRVADGKIVAFPFRQSSLGEQLALVISGYVFKSTYSLLSLASVIVLWRSKALDLVALRWAMIFFFLGENCCTVNYLLFHETSYLLEYLHSFGMVLCFGFTTHAVLEGIDHRILMLADPDRKCASLSLCRRCIKYTDAPCGLRRTFQLMIPACIVLALMPLFADWGSASYNTVIFGTAYNLSHLAYQQAYEFLYCPIIAIILLAASLLILSLKRTNPLPLAKLTFAAGVGSLGFGFFRLILASFYRRNMVWNPFWEECTELLFIVAVGCVLWTFREGLFSKEIDATLELS